MKVKEIPEIRGASGASETRFAGVQMPLFITLACSGVQRRQTVHLKCAHSFASLIDQNESLYVKVLPHST
jgi:hypothetical protein